MDYAHHYHFFGKLPTAEDAQNQRKEANVTGWLHDVFEFSALPGKGVRCLINGKWVMVSSYLKTPIDIFLL